MEPFDTLYAAHDPWVMDHEQDHWMTRREFAALARISVRTAKRWGRLGVGPAIYRVGPRSVRYRASEVREWIESGRTARPAQEAARESA